MDVYIGIDPGNTGGVGILWDTGSAFAFKIDGLTEHDLFLELDSIVSDAREEGRHIRAVIEDVSSSPQMGVKSAFTFGKNYGFWLGSLAGCGIPYARVRPQKWQKAMGCLSKGDKNVTKSAAQRLYPNEKITHATADALLLATYCRRHHHELF